MNAPLLVLPNTIFAQRFTISNLCIYQIFPPVNLFGWKFRHSANRSLFYMSNCWKYILYVHSFLVEAKQCPYWPCFGILHIHAKFIMVEVCLGILSNTSILAEPETFPSETYLWLNLKSLIQLRERNYLFRGFKAWHNIHY